MPAPGAGAQSPPGSVRGLPRSHRLKRRRELRRLFRRGEPGTVRVRTPDVFVAARLTERTQLPEGVRVQIVTAARRGTRGVQRNRVRRILSESFRVYMLPRLRSELIPALSDDHALAILLMDARRDDTPLEMHRIGHDLADRVPDLGRRLLG